MTIFEIVKIALDELYAEGMKDYGSDIDRRIKEKMSYLTENYKKLSDKARTPISYRDPATRFAYVYSYVAAHGDYLVQSLEYIRTSCRQTLFKNATLRLSCVGGGPGSDVVGVLKYISENTEGSTEKMLCYLLDGEQAWADTWTEVGDSLKSRITVNVNFQKLDVTDPTSWHSQKKFLNANLFTLSYFVSEVYALDNGIVSEFFKKLFDEAQSGSIILYVDNGHDTFNAYFDEQWKNRTDLECIAEETNVYKTPRYSEQASEIQVYKDKFGRFPKLKSQISMRALRKLE